MANLGVSVLLVLADEMDREGWGSRLESERMSEMARRVVEVERGERAVSLGPARDLGEAAPSPKEQGSIALGPSSAVAPGLLSPKPQLPSELSSLLDVVEQLALARECLAQLRVEMGQLQEAGMYPSVPTEQFQDRGGAGQYLYMLFRKDGGRYSGPEGKRKIYVGCDAAKIEEARGLASRRQRWERLDHLSRSLDSWLKSFDRRLSEFVASAATWPRPRVQLGLEHRGAAGASGPNGVEV